MTNLNPKQYIGLAMRQLADVPGIEPGMPGRTIRKVGVIGAGLMGSGIAVCFLGATIPTVLVDQSEEALAKGRKAIGKDLATGVKKGFLTEDQAKGLQVLLTTTVDYEALSDCDLIIEAVFERMDIKETVFKQLGEVAKPGAILATNTSGLTSITSPPPAGVRKTLSGCISSRPRSSCRCSKSCAARKPRQTFSGRHCSFRR